MTTFTDIKKFFINHGFEILLALCIAVIIILTLYNKITGNKGKWSKGYYYNSKSDKVDNIPKKTDSKGELECRRVVENIFKKPFNKIRPDFLRNNVTSSVDGGQYNMEIDCYNPELRLGVEYNGVQHYKYVPFFHRNRDAFHNQKYRDELKRRMCKDHNITLIEVPYNIQHEDIERYIISELSKHGYK
jgi:hypothetical protein